MTGFGSLLKMKRYLLLLLGLLVAAGGVAAAVLLTGEGTPTSTAAKAPPQKVTRPFQPRKDVDTNGVYTYRRMAHWNDPTSMDEIRRAALQVGPMNIAIADGELASGNLTPA